MKKMLNRHLFLLYNVLVNSGLKLVNLGVKVVNSGVLEFRVACYQNSHFIFERWNGMK